MFELGDERLLIEKLTGRNLSLIKLITDPDVIETILTPLSRLTLEMCCKIISPRSTHANSGSNNSTEDFDLSGRRPKESLACTISVVPYKKPLRLNQDRRGRKYSAWRVSDLHESYGIILVYEPVDALLKSAKVGELWVLVRPTLLPVPQLNKEINSNARGTEATTGLTRSFIVECKEQLLRIGELAEFRICNATTLSGITCGLPFVNEKGGRNQFCVHHQRRQQHSVINKRDLELNLQAEGVTVSNLGSFGDSSLSVVQRSSEVEFEMDVEGKLRFTSTSLKEGNESRTQTMPQETLTGLLRKRASIHEKLANRSREVLNDTSEEAAVMIQGRLIDSAESLRNSLVTITQFCHEQRKSNDQYTKRQIIRMLKSLRLPSPITQTLLKPIKDLLKCLSSYLPETSEFGSVLFVAKRKLKGSLTNFESQKTIEAQDEHQGLQKEKLVSSEVRKCE